MRLLLTPVLQQAPPVAMPEVVAVDVHAEVSAEVLAEVLAEVCVEVAQAEVSSASHQQHHLQR